MSSYTRKPVTATAHCPICPWIRTYFKTDNPKCEVKTAAAHGTAGHILSKHPMPKMRGGVQ
jgi:hypothetical protein